MESVQIQLQRMFNQTHALSQELSSVCFKVDYLNSHRVVKDATIKELKQANRQLVNMMTSSGGDGGGDRVSHIKLIDMKAMDPKLCDCKAETPFKAWAKKVRAYCNASRPGFRKCSKWVESQSGYIDFQVLSGGDWGFGNSRTLQAKCCTISCLCIRPTTRSSWSNFKTRTGSRPGGNSSSGTTP